MDELQADVEFSFAVIPKLKIQVKRASTDITWLQKRAHKIIVRSWGQTYLIDQKTLTPPALGDYHRNPYHTSVTAPRATINILTKIPHSRDGPLLSLDRQCRSQGGKTLGHYALLGDEHPATSSWWSCSDFVGQAAPSGKTVAWWFMSMMTQGWPPPAG